MSDVKSMVEYRDVPGFPGYRAGDDGSLSRRTTVARACIRKIVHRKGRYADVGGAS